MGIAEVEKRSKFWIHVRLKRDLSGISISDNACLTSRVVGLEWRTGGTEGIGFADFLSFDVAIVTVSITSGWDNCVVSLCKLACLDLGTRYGSRCIMIE